MFVQYWSPLSFYLPPNSNSRKKKEKKDDDDDDELFLGNGWPTKGVKTYFQMEPLSEILTIANQRQAASTIWTGTESEFRLCWRFCVVVINTALQRHLT